MKEKTVVFAVAQWLTDPVAVLADIKEQVTRLVDEVGRTTGTFDGQFQIKFTKEQ